VLHEAHAPDLAALVSRCSTDDLAAAEPTLSPRLPVVGRYLDHELIAAAAVVATLAGPSEVSVLVDPAHRRNGHAEHCELALMSIASNHMRWLQHRTIASDAPSQRLAANCGFRLISTETVLAERR